MKQSTKSLLLSIAKDRVDQAARSLINELSIVQQQGSSGLQQYDPRSHFSKWVQTTIWRQGYQDKSTVMLEAVETYAQHLIRKVKEVRDLQDAYNEVKAIKVDEEVAV